MENIVKPLKDKSEIDYTIKSSMTYYTENNSRYCVSIVEEFYSEMDGIEQTGSYIVTVLSERGTFTSKVQREEVGVELEFDVKGFVELIGLKAVNIIEGKLK